MPGERDLNIVLAKYCRAPSRNGKYCLLACFKRESPYSPCDRQLTEGGEAVTKYFSGIFGEISNIPKFIKNLNGFEVREILSECKAFSRRKISLGLGETRRRKNNWKGVSVTFYLCPTGPGGGVGEPNTKSEEFKIKDIMKWTPESYPGYVPLEEAKLAEVA